MEKITPDEIQLLKEEVQKAFKQEGFEKEYEFALKTFKVDIYQQVEVVNTIMELGDGIKDVLDIGILFGYYAVLLKKRLGVNIIGLEPDINPENICALPEKYGISVLKAKIIPGKKIPFDNKFDLIIFSQVLEHLPYPPVSFLETLVEALKDEKYLVLATPNIASLANVIKLMLGKNILESFPDIIDPAQPAKEYRLGHIREYTMKECVAIMEQAGLQVVVKRYSLGWDVYNKFLYEGIGGKSYKKKILDIIRGMLVKVYPPLSRQLILVGKKRSG